MYSNTTSTILASLRIEPKIAPILTIPSDRIINHGNSYIKEVQIYQNKTILITLKDGQEKLTAIQQVIREPGKLAEKLDNFSFQVRLYEIDNEIISFRLEINPRLFGGGGCSSKVAPTDEKQKSVSKKSVSGQESDSYHSKRKSYQSDKEEDSAKDSDSKDHSQVDKIKEDDAIKKKSSASRERAEIKQKPLSAEETQAIRQEIDQGNIDQLKNWLPRLPEDLRHHLLDYVIVSQCPDDKKLAILKALFVSGKTDLNLKDANGNTLVVNTVASLIAKGGANHEVISAIIRFLIENGADPTIENRDGKTPYRMIARSYVIAAVLIEVHQIQDMLRKPEIHAAASSSGKDSELQITAATGSHKADHATVSVQQMVI